MECICSENLMDYILRVLKLKIWLLCGKNLKTGKSMLHLIIPAAISYHLFYSIIFTKLYIVSFTMLYSVMLMAVAYLNSKKILTDILDAIFGSMVLIVGVEEIKSIKNIERLKRELRVRIVKLISKLLVWLIVFVNYIIIFF